MPKNKNLSKITSYLTADTDNGILSSNVSQTITGSLTVTGNLTAQQFIVSSSVTYLTESFASGSHKFGDSSDDIHTFTGSLVVSGSSNPLTVGTNLLFVSSSGNVGIGTTSPGSKLAINAGASGGLRIDTNSTYNAISIGGTGIFSIDAPGVSGGRLIVLDNGNTGIGTASPSTKLHVYEPLTNTTAYLTIQNNRARNAAVYTQTTNGGFYAGTSIGTDTFNYQIYDGVAGAARLTISSTGAATFSNNVTLTNSVFPVLTVQGTVSSPHIGSTWSVSANQDGNGRTIIGTAGQGRAMYFENNGDINIPNNSLSVAGQLIISAGQTGGYVTSTSGYVNETRTVTTNGTSYYLYKSTGTSNGSSSTIFNITGLSTSNGTFADIYAVAQKDATGNAINTNLEVQINGQYMVGIQAGGTSANTVRNAFRVCRMDGSWIIIGTVRT
jgi:hypothetical protein